MKGSLFQECYLCYFNKNVFFITGNFQNNHDSLTSCKYGPLSNVVQQQRKNEHDDFRLKNRGFSLFICWKEIKKIRLRQVRVLLRSFAKGMKVRSLEFYRCSWCIHETTSWECVKGGSNSCSMLPLETIAQVRGFAMHRIISSTYMVRWSQKLQLVTVCIDACERK